MCEGALTQLCEISEYHRKKPSKQNIWVLAIRTQDLTKCIWAMTKTLFPEQMATMATPRRTLGQAPTVWD